MYNESLIKAGKDILKNLIINCSISEQMMFKRMYSPDNIELSIFDVIDNMDPKKIDWAITQVERTLKNKHFKVNEREPVLTNE